MSNVQLAPGGVYAVIGDHLHIIAQIPIHGSNTPMWICRWVKTGRVEALLTEQLLACRPVPVPKNDSEDVAETFTSGLQLEFVPTLTLMRKAMERVNCAVIILQGVRNTELDELLNEERVDEYSSVRIEKGSLPLQLGLLQLATHNLMSEHFRGRDSDGSEAWKNNS